MRSALYFPHTEIKSKALVKNSLLLWDNLEYIVPWEEYKPYYEDKEIAEAVELIGEAFYPTDDVKRRTHEILEDFATSPLPEPFYYKDLEQNQPDYEIYPQKFSRGTWEMLQGLQLAGKQRLNNDYPLSEPAGLCIMSILADCCAGETRARITDRGVAYATIANLAVDNSAKSNQRATERMISVTLKMLNLSDVPLRNLIDFRKREKIERSGYSLMDLRHNYLKQIEEHAKEVLQKTNPRDVDQLHKDFEADMKKDLKKLSDEIWRAKVDVIFSKESLAALAAVTAAVAVPHILPFAVPGIVSLGGGPVAAIGGAISVANKYATARQSILQKHPMAYLYELDRSR